MTLVVLVTNGVRNGWVQNSSHLWDMSIYFERESVPEFLGTAFHITWPYCEERSMGSIALQGAFLLDQFVLRPLPTKKAHQTLAHARASVYIWSPEHG